MEPSVLERGRARGRLDEDLPHRPRGDAEEVRAALERQVRALEEPEVRLVHEGRGLERVPGPLEPRVPARDAPEVGIDERHERPVSARRAPAGKPEP